MTEREISEALRQGVLDLQEARLAKAYLGTRITVTDPCFQSKTFPIPALPEWYYPTQLPDPTPDADIW